jgi:hypothetical protein
MATVTFATHVQQLGAGYKRPLGGVGAPPSADVLALPTAAPQVGVPFPARPARGANETHPVSHLAFERLLPGEIVFAKTYRGHEYAGVPGALTNMTPVLSLDEMNDLLADPVNHVEETTPGSLYTLVRARSVLRRLGPNRLRRMRFKAFDASALDNSHPVRQYALQGVVCARTEEAECPANHSSPVHECTVAVWGPSVFALDRDADDRCAGQPTFARAPFFVQPATVLSAVYVVLVAHRVAANRVRLQYEVVTQSHLDADAGGLYVGGPRFRTLMVAARKGGANGTKRVLGAQQLGTLMDVRFQRDGRAFVINVCVKPYERVTCDNTKNFLTIPVDSFDLFKPPPSKDVARQLAAACASGRAVLAHRRPPGSALPYPVFVDGTTPDFLEAAADAAGLIGEGSKPTNEDVQTFLDNAQAQLAGTQPADGTSAAAVLAAVLEDLMRERA